MRNLELPGTAQIVLVEVVDEVALDCRLNRARLLLLLQHQLLLVQFLLPPPVAVPNSLQVLIGHVILECFFIFPDKQVSDDIQITVLDFLKRNRCWQRLLLLGRGRSLVRDVRLVRCDYLLHLVLDHLRFGLLALDGVAEGVLHFCDKKFVFGCLCAALRRLRHRG